MVGIRRGVWAVLGTFLFMPGCSGGQEWREAEPLHLLCGAAAPAEVCSQLRLQGIESVEGDSSLGVTNIYVRGTWEETYRARDLVWKLAEERGWWIIWLAEALILPGSGAYRRMEAAGSVREKPGSIRVASVVHTTAPSGWLLSQLKQAGFSAYVAFGYTEDYIFVSRNEAGKAVRLLADLPPLPGVTVHPYTMESY